MPDQGYTPAGGVPPVSPFSSFDNRIRYHDMVRNQVISQYHQSNPVQVSLTPDQIESINRDPKYRYGVQNQQQHYELHRQTMMNLQSAAGGITYAASSAAAYGAVGSITMAAAKAALGPGMVSFGLGGFLAPMAIGGFMANQVNKGVQQSLTRQRYMHQIASDVEQYRGQLGFDQTLSYGQASNLGAQLYNSMKGKDEFFDAEQQMRMHKIAVSNNMISARGKGVTSGTVTQYKKNFQELKETTEEVVKLLQTTIEGGMSVIKEMNQAGFSSLKDIKAQIRHAKAVGDITGLGFQNTSQIGLAGAMAVQGTPISAAQGTRMYQAGSMQAYSISQGSSEGSYLVGRAGGVAGAGQYIASAQMNAVMSGMGTRMLAYAMNPDGTINDSKMGSLLSGRVSSYDVNVGANQTGYNMGTKRVMFDVYRRRALNKMTPEAMNRFFKQQFNLWRSQRGGGVEEQAHVFSGLYSNDPLQQELLRESLLGTDIMSISRNRGMALGYASNMVDSPVGPVENVFRTIGRGITKPLQAIGYAGTEGLFRGLKAVGRGAVNAVDWYGKTAATNLRWAFGDPDWMLRKQDLGNFSESIIANLGGAGLTEGESAAMSFLGGAGQELIEKYRYSERERGRPKQYKFENLTAKQYQLLFQKVTTAVASGTEDKLVQDYDFTKLYSKIAPGQRGAFKLADPTVIMNNVSSSMNQYNISASKKYDIVKTRADNYLSDQYAAHEMGRMQFGVVVGANGEQTEQFRKDLNYINENGIREATSTLGRDRTMRALYYDQYSATENYQRTKDTAAINAGDFDINRAQSDLKKMTKMFGYEYAGRKTIGVEPSSIGYTKREVIGVGKSVLVKSKNLFGMNNAGIYNSVTEMGRVREASEMLSDPFVDKTKLDKAIAISGAKSSEEFASNVQKIIQQDEVIKAVKGYQKGAWQFETWAKGAGIDRNTTDYKKAEAYSLGEAGWNDLTTGAKKLLVEKSGATGKETLDRIFKQYGEEGLYQRVFGGKGNESKNSDRDRVNELNKSILELAKSITSMTEKDKLSDKEKKQLEKMREVAEDYKREKEAIEQSSVDDNSKTAIQTSIAPPILNYWNNRWQY